MLKRKEEKETPAFCRIMWPLCFHGTGHPNFSSRRMVLQHFLTEHFPTRRARAGQSQILVLKESGKFALATTGVVFFTFLPPIPPLNNLAGFGSFTQGIAHTLVAFSGAEVSLRNQPTRDR